MAHSQDDLLNALKGDLILIKSLLLETATDMIENEFTSYPIFVAHVLELPIGQVLIDREEIGTTFSISASTLEEFNEKGLVQSDKKALFKQTYKDPKKFMCLFLISEKGGKFVFIPYDSDLQPSPPNPPLN